MKIKKLIVRAVSLFMVGLITTLALIIPTSAIITEYPTEDNTTYYNCVVPFNVNFVGTDGTLDYVYSVPVGYNSPVVQTGLNGHDTLTGRVLGYGGVAPNTATLEYYYYPTEWRIGYDGTEYDDGWGGVPVELRIDNTEIDGKTIVIDAPTFYVNPLVSNWYRTADPDTYNRWAMGAFRMPSVTDPSTQAYVGRYTVYANVVDDVGTKHPVSYSKVIDTRTDNNWTPFLEPSIFQDYVINSIQETGYNRIVAVTDFKAYVDCDYYEYTAPEPADELQGTWVFGSGIGDGNKTWAVDFTSNDSVFNNLEVKGHPDGANGVSLWYVDTLLPHRIEVANDPFGGDATFINENYKTITITSTLSSVTDGSTLLAYLNTNAIKKGGSSSEVGEWQLVENSPLKATGIDVSYPVYDRYTFDNDPQLALNEGYPDFTRYISKFRGVGSLDINTDFTGWIATATSGFLNFELLPNFSIGGVLAILVGFSLVILFLKVFAGG